MKQQQMSLKMIEMYIDLIKDEFAPLFDFYRVQNQNLREEVKNQVRKDLGIYKTVLELSALEKKVGELKMKVDEWEGKTYVNGEHISKIEIEVRRRMREDENNPLVKIEEKMNGIIKGVKLAGCASEVRETFKEIAKFVASEQSRIKSLPKAKKIGAIELD
jgi:hypothetical protein